MEETASQYFENYPSDKHVVSAEQLLNRVEEGESFCLLDIRSAEDYAKGHIQGAVNIPYGVDVADALEIIPNDQPVLVYCYSGQTASQPLLCFAWLERMPTMSAAVSPEFPSRKRQNS